MIARWLLRRWLRANREELIELLWSEVKTNGHGPRERTARVLDRLVTRSVTRA